MRYVQKSGVLRYLWTRAKTPCTPFQGLRPSHVKRMDDGAAMSDSRLKTRMMPMVARMRLRGSVRFILWRKVLRCVMSIVFLGESIK